MIAIAIIISLLFIAALGPALFAAVALIIVAGPRTMTHDGVVFTGGRHPKHNKFHGKSQNKFHGKSHGNRSQTAPQWPEMNLDDVSLPLTYTLDTDLFTQDKVAEFMAEPAWTYLTLSDALTKPSVDFAFILSMPSHRPTKSLGIPTRLRYRLSADELTDKVKFHQHMAGLHPGHIARSFEVHAMSRLPIDHPVWIVRANWGWKGSANAIVSTTEELRAAYPKLIKDDRSRVLMSEYIINPRLHDGRKFHARVVVIAGVIARGETLRKTAIMLPLVELIIAAKPYSADNYVDTDVHDTHYGPDAGHAFFESGDTLYDSTVDCMKRVFNDLMPLVDKYPESPAAYDAFGVDIIYLVDGTPIIMEINKLPGLGFEDPAVNDRALTEIINGVMVAAVDPAFGTSCGRPDDLITLVDTAGPLVPDTPQRTFLYVGDQLEDAAVASYLPGWRRITSVIPGSSVDLIIGAGAAMASGKLYSVSAHMKHRLQIKDITDKVKLHEHLVTLAPETIPETFTVDKRSTIEDGSAWIIRAGWGFDGQAVKIATNTTEMQEIAAEFHSRNPKKGRAESTVIATRYIRNPMLINDRKFNVRVMMVAVVHSPEAIARGCPKKAVYMLRKCNITTSVLPYVDSDFANSSIHITHDAKPTDPVRYHFHQGYPGDAAAVDAAMDRMEGVLRDAICPLLDRVECFQESPSGYEILGADIVFDATGRPYIIEVNDVPGISWLKMIPEGAAEYSKAYLDFLFGAIGPEFEMNVPAEYSVELCRI